MNYKKNIKSILKNTFNPSEHTLAEYEIADKEESKIIEAFSELEILSMNKYSNNGLSVFVELIYLNGLKDLIGFDFYSTNDSLAAIKLNSKRVFSQLIELELFFENSSYTKFLAKFDSGEKRVWVFNNAMRISHLPKIVFCKNRLKTFLEEPYTLEHYAKNSNETHSLGMEGFLPLNSIWPEINSSSKEMKNFETITGKNIIFIEKRLPVRTLIPFEEVLSNAPLEDPRFEPRIAFFTTEEIRELLKTASAQLPATLDSNNNLTPLIFVEREEDVFLESETPIFSYVYTIYYISSQFTMEGINVKASEFGL